jgi:CDP-diacylglycerol--serine O-phosphatidyltransferase
LPNILTFINLSLGVIAILMTVTDDSVSALIYASLLVLFAAFTDRLDGQVARKLGVSSALGKELDSLSDLISFGVAPIIIAWKINFINLGPLGYLLVLAFPIAGAYRLARFNVEEFENIFRGIPITIAGAFLSIINIFNCFQQINNKYNIFHTLISIFIILLLSFLMVSNIKLRKV